MNGDLWCPLRPYPSHWKSTGSMVDMSGREVVPSLVGLGHRPRVLPTNLCCLSRLTGCPSSVFGEGKQLDRVKEGFTSQNLSGFCFVESLQGYTSLFTYKTTLDES